MLLVVDVGNTQTHFGTYRGEELVEHWRFATVPDSTADELGAALRNLLELRGVRFADLARRSSRRRCRSSSPSGRDGRRYLGHDMIVVGPGIEDRDGDAHRQPARARRRPARQRGRRLRTVGGAVHRGRLRDRDQLRLVSAEGEYLGGIIAPGVEISMEALNSARGANCRAIDLAPPRAVIGKSTIDAIRSGIVYGFAAQVDGIVGRMREELGRATPTIATGGLAEHIVPYSRRRSTRSTPC